MNELLDAQLWTQQVQTVSARELNEKGFSVTTLSALASEDQRWEELNKDSERLFSPEAMNKASSNILSAFLGRKVKCTRFR